ncbi:MAG: hypothetical protein KF878_08680 [Planctomycetes bacterium]|nr:hypothetical protein [Planctomycetota bacterium]
MSVLAYVSGHGFGHWTRTSPLLEDLARRLPVHVRTSGRALPWARRAPWPASVEDVDVGPGAVQQGPLHVDVQATREALARHLERWPHLVRAEVARGRDLGATLVVADVPPLAFEVARRLDVPAVAVANFTWSWIYAGWADRDAWFEVASARLRVAEGLATHVVALPGGGGLDALGPPRPHLALRRPPTCSVDEARRRLPRPRPDDPRPVVLVSFGGYGDALDLAAIARAHPDHAFVTFAPPKDPPPENLVVLPHDHDLDHQDLVLGADVLLGKPGYGTLSECLERPTPFVAVVGDDVFREHPRLRAFGRRVLPWVELSEADLLAGRWGPALAAAQAARPAEAPPRNGLDAARAVVAAALDGRSDPGLG